MEARLEARSETDCVQKHYRKQIGDDHILHFTVVLPPGRCLRSGMLIFSTSKLGTLKEIVKNGFLTLYITLLLKLAILVHIVVV